MSGLFASVTGTPRTPTMERGGVEETKTPEASETTIPTAEDPAARQALTNLLEL